MKQCSYCRRRFEPSSPRQRFCCAEHRLAAKAVADATRYGRDHRQLRARLRGLVARGAAVCSRCGGRIEPGEEWDLDHTDDGLGYRGPAHRDCNRRTSSRVERFPVLGEIPPDDPTRGLFFGPEGQRWSRIWIPWP